MLLLLHAPPITPSLNIVVAPTHTVDAPLIGVGVVFTFTVVVIRQVVGNVYVMIVVPNAIPVTIPVEVPIVAVAGVLLIHVPPPGSVNVMVAPTHTAVGPLIGAGKGLIIIATLPLMVLLQLVVALVATTV
jgi:hypothetical protein